MNGGGIQNQARGAVGHVQVYVKLLVHALDDIHGKAGGEQARAVAVHGIGPFLQQGGRMAGFVFYQPYGAIFHYVGYGQVHVLANRYHQGVAASGGIHLVLLMVQAQGISYYIVEREVYIVGMVGKHRSQMRAHGGRQGYLRTQTQFGFQLCGYVGYQLELIINPQVFSAVALVLVYEAASGENRSQGHEPKADMFPVVQHYLPLTFWDCAFFWG